MSEQRERKLDDAMTAVRREQAGAERYRRFQREAIGGQAPGRGHSRPLEFDESGFPIAQRGLSFATRVARLLSS